MTATAARPAWRLPLFAALVLAAVLAPVASAAAHTRTQETTNLDSRITRDPDLPGVPWRVYTGGLLVEVSNTGGAARVDPDQCRTRGPLARTLMAAALLVRVTVAAGLVQALVVAVVVVRARRAGAPTPSDQERMLAGT